jgi:hypothetical protein
LVAIRGADILIPLPGERSLTFGRSRSGKSSLEDCRLGTIRLDRPDAMIIIVDTKPRFRAETKRGLTPKSRKDASDLYESWSKGPVVPFSVVMDLKSERPFQGLFEKPSEIAIMQSGDASDWRHMLVLIDAFTRAQIKGRERVVFVDEALDFYQRNTWGITPTNDPLYRISRAGGERAITSMIDAHRVHGLPPLMLNMASRITLFHLADDNDMKHLRQQVGIKDAASPTGDYIFRQWTIQPGGEVSLPFQGKLTLPEQYLNQLSET